MCPRRSHHDSADEISILVDEVFPPTAVSRIGPGLSDSQLAVGGKLFVEDHTEIRVQGRARR